MKNVRSIQYLLTVLMACALGMPVAAQQSETRTNPNTNQGSNSSNTNNNKNQNDQSGQQNSRENNRQNNQTDNSRTRNNDRNNNSSDRQNDRNGNASQANSNNHSGSATSDDTANGRVSSGQKQKLSGIIIRKEADTLLVRDFQGTQYNVSLNGSTKIRERKSNPFRGAKKYSSADLSRGLTVEIDGRGNDAGALVANEIKFSDTEHRMASSLVSLVTPVEGRVSEAETRVSAAEQNAQRLSGQLDELAAVANMANGGAKTAQETADKAMVAANSANERITATTDVLNSRISSLDEYEAAKTVSLTFKVGSAVLSTEAKASLDEIATQAKNEKGYVIQVAGYASADGNETLNRRLSQRRAEAVMSYLIENHEISQRRIVTPLGFGEARPVADNATREGRKENRRVEVAILVNNGLTRSNGTTSNVTPQQ